MRYANRTGGVKQRIQVMLDQDVYDYVKRAAEKNGLTVSAAASKIISSFMKASRKAVAVVKKDGVKHDV